MKVISGLLYVVSIIFIGMGLHRIFVYKNPDSILLDSVNSHVGGDAYNYIINAGQATAFFVLATLFTIAAGTLMIIDTMNNNRNIDSKKIEEENI